MKLRRGLPLLLACAAAGGAAAQTLPSPEPGAGPPARFDELVVTARRRALAPLEEPIDYFRRHCFEANRLGRQSLAPNRDRDWEPLDEANRRRAGIADPAVEAFSLADPARGHSLVLRLERIAGRGGLTESRCTLVVLGGANHERLVDRMGALFRMAGTQRHVGHADGVEPLPGWRQWIWTAMPGRGSRNWRGRPGGSWLVVSDPAFYDRFDYLLGDLKISREGRRPVSILSLAHVTRDSGARAPRR